MRSQQNRVAVQNIRYFLQVVGLLALLIGGVGIINTMQVLLRRRQHRDRDAQDDGLPARRPLLRSSAWRRRCSA